jgi:hypothetical protein
LQIGVANRDYHQVSQSEIGEGAATRCRELSLLFETFQYESLLPSALDVCNSELGYKPMEQPDRHLPRMIIVAAMLAMAGCGSGSREQVSPTAHSFSRDRYEIPTAAAAILDKADHFELLSLDPRLQLNAADGDFYGYRVFGTAVIRDAESRQKLVSAFKRAVAEKPVAIAACFNPRHGIRARKSGEQADFVICFECRQVHVSYGQAGGEFRISNSAEALFDSVLQSHGLALADK